MRYVEAGGVKLSAIGLGCWQFGSREWAYGDHYADVDAVEITKRALDLGINLIDTAEAYAFGRSERIVAKGIGARRDEVFLATKIMPVLPLPPVVRWRARASADRLRVDVIDLYQLHWPNPAFPLSTTMSGMRSLEESGLVRHVGVSNYSLGRWQRAEASLGGPVISNQVHLSLVHRGPTADLVPWAQRNDRLVIAYSPLAQGLLSGRYDAGHKPPGMRATSTGFLDENLVRVTPLIEGLRDVARGHGVSPAQVALAWVIRRPNTVAIPGASSVEQLESNVEAAEIELTDDEDGHLTRLAEEYQPVTGPAAVPLKVKARVGRT